MCCKRLISWLRGSNPRTWPPNTTRLWINESPRRIWERLQEQGSGRTRCGSRLAGPFGETSLFATSHASNIYMPTSSLTWPITHEFWLSGNGTVAPCSYSCTNARATSPSFNASVIRRVCLQRRPRALPRRQGEADEPCQCALKCVTKVFFLEAGHRAALRGHIIKAFME